MNSLVGQRAPDRGAQRPVVRRRGVRRRGIVLLLSLSLLTLFLMMLVTLIVITGQYRQSARVQARQERVGDPPHKIADIAFRTIAVGDGAAASVAQGHELFRDLYGSSWRGEVESPTSGSGFPSFYTSAPAAEPLRGNPGSTSTFITFNFRRPAAGGGYVNLFTDSSAGDYTNCVLTFVHGSTGKNVSVRILEYVPPTSNSAPDCFIGRFTIARSNPDHMETLPDAASLLSTATTLAGAGEKMLFLVNERPFSGYGAGYAAIEDTDPAPPNLTGQLGYNIERLWHQQYGSSTSSPVPTAPLPAALLSNYREIDPTLATIGFGGLNEDYDAVDFQNMFLAYVPPGAQRADQIVPSFWRPALVNYWRHHLFDHDNDGTADVSLWYYEDGSEPRQATDPLSRSRRNQFYRRLFLRPLPTDHPEFTGSNPDFGLPVHPDPSSVSPAVAIQWRFWQPLSLLTGSNDIDGDGTADENSMSGSPFWPPMPDPRSPVPPFDPLSDVNGNGVLDQWDVDNDNDGLTDSIWIDVGLPVQRMEDGKLYKPLVAFLIRDLDGLANLNAHLHPDFLDARPSDVSAGPLAGSPGMKNRARGRGFGPAELGFPGSLFNNDQIGALLAARYGGTGIDERVGRPNVNDIPSLLRHPTLPQFFYNAGVATEWGTPPDAWGTQAIGLDYFGQPWNDRIGLTPAQLRTHMVNVHTPTPPFQRPFSAVLHPNGPTEGGDDPYEIDLYAAHAAASDSTAGFNTPDTPYTLAELERVLRWNDSDAASLPNRLVTTVNPGNDTNPAYAFNDIGRRRAVTTHSSTIPVVPSAVPSERRTENTDPRTRFLGNPENWSLYHLFAGKLINEARTPASPFNGLTHATPNFDPLVHRGWVDNEVRKMLPWEAWHGMKMDLNRRWQNGFDDNGNGIVDEPTEAAGEQIFPGITELSAYNGLFDHFGADNQLPQSPFNTRFVRQIYARHLYCLALFLMDYQAYDGAPGFDPREAFQDMELTSDWNRADEIFKRRLAQWAINVVDARDSDAICTPFEYDRNPFNGWQANIDGNPATLDLIAAGDPGDRRLVWGTEAPHLLISETLALHNRRVADTDRDNGNQRTRSDSTPDPDLDQHRLPQGSFFVELFGVGNRVANTAHLPSELYVNGQLELDKVAPGGAGVWRLAITEQHADDDDTPFRRATNNVRPETTSYDPQDMNLLTLTNPNLGTAEQLIPPAGPADPARDFRYVYFTTAVPPAGSGAEQVNTFYRRSAAPARVTPGASLVVAPRANTYLSLTDDGDDSTRPTEGQARIAVNGTTLENYGNFDDSGTHQIPAPATFGTTIPTPQAIVCAADPPASWTNVTTPVGLNVSEPLPRSTGFYYLEPTDAIVNDSIIDGYAPWDDDSAQTLPDQPFDERTGSLLENVEGGTTRNWKTVFLQRLANPMLAFHPLENPYITVDFAPIDLNVYNGDDRQPAGFMGTWDPQDPNHTGPDTFDGLRFGSTERGRGKTRSNAWQSYYPVTNGYDDLDFVLWPHEFARSPETTASVPGAMGVLNVTEFRHNLVHTLGYLNVTWGMPADPAGYVPPGANYLGAPPHLNPRTTPPGPPAGTVYSFPWLNWPDRPYATPFELLTVPFSSASTWYEDWSRNNFVLDPAVRAYDGADPQDYRGYYSHLLNFFHGARESRNPTETATTPRLGRLFDFVETKSPFAGSQEFFDAPDMSRAPGTLRDGNNFLSRFRDPGRINLNTMPPQLWDSFRFANNANLTVAEFAQSRGIPSGDATYLYPTRVPRPFRSELKADVAPLLSDSYPNDERLRQLGIEGTLLRSDRAVTNNNPEEPMLAGDRRTQQWQHTDKNPYFRYEQLTRLPNLTSTHSNVYAVWVTVGYFEAYKTSPVTRNPALAGHYAGEPLPDGVWLGPEIGADTGRNRRHRAFYILDRSIPVAFEPGNPHNFEKAILLRRYLD